MLVGIVRKQNNNYYISARNINNYIYYNVIMANNNETRNLKREEAEELIYSLFDGNKKFLEHRNDYDIYIDDSGNKRYFKDGKEDLIKFFLNNGQSAIMSLGKKEKDFLLKSFQVTNKDLIKELLIVYLSVMIVLNVDANVLSRIHYEDNKIVYDKRIELEDAREYIYDSDGDITKEQQDYLYNDDFINDALIIADDSRNYILRQKLKDIYVDYGGECFNTHSLLLGYYSPLVPNCIHLKDDSKKISDFALAHEFVHLLQDDNYYYYVKEACAEMMAEEYYDKKAEAYPKQRENVKLLLEMIGPKSIMELNFKGDTSSFEKEIYNNLEKEDADRLLELFKEVPAENEKIDEVDKEIRGLLDKMSYKLYGIGLDDQNNDAVESAKRRMVYFNRNNELYYFKLNYVTGSSEDPYKINLDDVDFSNVIKYNVIFKEDITEEEYNKLKNIESENYMVYEHEDWPKGFSYVNSDPVSGEHYYDVEGEVVSKSEAIAKGYCIYEYCKYTKEEVNSLDEVKKKTTDNDYSRANVLFNNETEGIIDFGSSTIMIIPVEEKVEILPMDKKFPEQFQEEKTILNEVLETIDEIKDKKRL